MNECSIFTKKDEEDINNSVHSNNEEIKILQSILSKRDAEYTKAYNDEKSNRKDTRTTDKPFCSNCIFRFSCIYPDNIKCAIKSNPKKILPCNGQYSTPCSCYNMHCIWKQWGDR